MKLIAAQWQSYLDTVVPKTASPTQIVETRRAFYAGAMGFFDALMNNPALAADADDETGMAHLNALYQELLEFGRSIPKG